MSFREYMEVHATGGQFEVWHCVDRDDVFDPSIQNERGVYATLQEAFAHAAGYCMEVEVNPAPDFSAVDFMAAIKAGYSPHAVNELPIATMGTPETELSTVDLIAEWKAAREHLHSLEYELEGRTPEPGEDWDHARHTMKCSRCKDWMTYGDAEYSGYCSECETELDM